MRGTRTGPHVRQRVGLRSFNKGDYHILDDEGLSLRSRTAPRQPLILRAWSRRMEERESGYGKAANSSVPLQRNCVPARYNATVLYSTLLLLLLDGTAVPILAGRPGAPPGRVRGGRSPPLPSKCLLAYSEACLLSSLSVILSTLTLAPWVGAEGICCILQLILARIWRLCFRIIV